MVHAETRKQGSPFTIRCTPSRSVAAPKLMGINQEINAESFLEYHPLVLESEGRLPLDLKRTTIFLRALRGSA